jgi:hypothetical protein
VSVATFRALAAAYVSSFHDFEAAVKVDHGLARPIGARFDAAFAAHLGGPSRDGDDFRAITSMRFSRAGCARHRCPQASEMKDPKPWLSDCAVTDLNRNWQLRGPSMSVPAKQSVV